MFFLGNPFQPSVMIAKKAGAYPNEALSDAHFRIGSWPYSSMLEKPATDKHSRLFGPFVSYKEKKVVTSALACW